MSQGVLPLCRGKVSVFYSSSQLGKIIIDNIVNGVDVKIRTDVVSLSMEVTIDESEVKFRKLACAESMLMKDADLRNTSM